MSSLSDSVKYRWSEDCSIAFEKIKAILTSPPVLITPDYSKQFSLTVDASDVGIGAFLTQKVDDIDHPLGYFSKKLDKHQMNYSTIEKECLAFIKALQHFKVSSVSIHRPQPTYFH